MDDLATWWPKLRVGGVMAGHDYTEQSEPRVGSYRGCEWKWRTDPAVQGMDWTLNFDGSRDLSGRVVKGAVDDFFGGVHPRSPLRTCPRQISVTYREGCFNSWLVSK